MYSFSATTLAALFGASTAFAALTPYPPPPATGDACATACIAAYRTCQGNTSIPRSQCASELSRCVGYTPFDDSGSFVTPTACSATPSATSSSVAPPNYGGGADTCAAKCVTAYRTCQGNPSNTRSQCASELSSCIGYVPFDNSGSFVTPTACSTTATATATTSGSSTPQPTGDCATSCINAYRACQSNTSNNRSLCASNLATCLGYNPFDNSGSLVTPTACSTTATATSTVCSSSTPQPTADCATSCVQAYRACQSNTSNNRSLCASNLASCLGYNPFDKSGSFVTPTACSTTATATSTATASGSSNPQPTADCATSCVNAYRACQSNTSNNRSLCASNLASCVGYNPFDNSGSFVTPTACSASSAAPTQTNPTAAVPVPATTGTSSSSSSSSSSSCAAACVTAYRTCQSDTTKNRSLCASNIASCLGYNPFDNSGSFVTPTACSGTQPTGAGNATTSVPAVYTGAAAFINTGGSLAAVAAGAVALLV